MRLIVADQIRFDPSHQFDQYSIFAGEIEHGLSGDSKEMGAALPAHTLTMNKAIDQGSFKMTQKIAAARIARVVAIVEGLPGAGAIAAGNHLSLEVRQKRFGWIGLWLDTPQIDWAEVKAILVGAYRLTAPRKLIVELDAKHNA